jgi:hypothetical protein
MGVCISRVLGFCKDTYSLNTVYSLGGLTVDDSVLYVVGIVGDVQYIFYEGPDVLTGYVRQYFGVGFCHGRRGNPRVVDFSVQRGVIGRAEDNKSALLWWICRMVSLILRNRMG